MGYPLLESLAEEHRREVLSAAVRRRFAKNEVVFHEGDPARTLHLVASGRFAIRVTTPVGDVATVNILGSGASFGELSLLGDETRSATAVALEPSSTLALDRADFDRLCREHPRIEHFLAVLLADRVRRLTTLVEEALFVPAEQRVARRLLELGDLYGDGESGAVSIPLSQEQLATVAGTTRPTTNRVLRAAADDGAVALARGRIDIIDRAALQRRAR